MAYTVTSAPGPDNTTRTVTLTVQCWASQSLGLMRELHATMARAPGARPDVAKLWDRQLGEVTRLALSGAWRADVEAYEMAADVARLPEVDRLLWRCVRDAAKHNLGDAIDSARSAVAACREVPALAAVVDRIVAILEAT
jgi:hypothetical protein